MASAPSFAKVSCLTQCFVSNIDHWISLTFTYRDRNRTILGGFCVTRSDEASIHRHKKGGEPCGTSAPSTSNSYTKLPKSPESKKGYY
ncbi:hypothetical protein HZ326_28704 [Fusarium oxysporum f. sp. albedinis]|nr:hypothetical protein HZ326_28704 [Fusarium oxysporum f. sp. albedinis]